MIKRTLIASAILLSTTANAYMFEGTYSYVGGKIEPQDSGNDDIDISGSEVDLRVYLEDVDVSKGAWEEAAFLNKASFVAGRWLGVELKDDTSNAEEDKANAYEVGGRAVVNDTFIIQAVIGTENDDSNEKDQWSSFGFGAYFNEYHSLTGDVTFAKGTDFFLGDPYDLYRLGVNYHGVYPVGTSPMSMALDVTVFAEGGTYNVIADSVNDTQQGGFEAMFTYYPIPMFGIGAGLDVQGGSIDQEIGGDLDVTIMSSSIFAHWYPVEQFRIGFDYTAESRKYEDNLTDEKLDINAWTVNVRVRF